MGAWQDEVGAIDTAALLAAVEAALPTMYWVEASGSDEDLRLEHFSGEVSRRELTVEVVTTGGQVMAVATLKPGTILRLPDSLAAEALRLARVFTRKEEGNEMTEGRKWE